MNWNRPYSSIQWKKLRTSHLKKYPFCNNCSSTLSLQIDHILEHKNDISLFLDPNNLQTLCARCHGIKSSKYQQLLNLKNNNLKLIININVSNGINLNNKKFLKFTITQFERLNNSIIYNFNHSNLDSGLSGLLIDYIYEIMIYFKSKFSNIKLNFNDKYKIIETISKKLNFCTNSVNIC